MCKARRQYCTAIATAFSKKECSGSVYRCYALHHCEVCLIIDGHENFAASSYAHINFETVIHMVLDYTKRTCLLYAHTMSIKANTLLPLTYTRYTLHKSCSYATHV
jgi:hypothetical protein